MNGTPAAFLARPKTESKPPRAATNFGGDWPIGRLDANRNGKTLEVLQSDYGLGYATD
jgi:hypothetical protein